MCPAGHELQKSVSQGGGGFCDMCGSDIGGGDLIFGCEECNWDCCMLCHNPDPVADSKRASLEGLAPLDCQISPGENSWAPASPTDQSVSSPRQRNMSRRA